jgi:transcriptional regulator of NAD metabolism
MNADARRKEILHILSGSGTPVSATALAQKLNVSRQVIVGDIALLRAKGSTVIATPRGYLLQYADKGIMRQIACAHCAGDMRAELDAIVDQGCRVIDVIVEHPVYGQLAGMLQIATRDDVGQFILRCADSQPLSYLTGGVHLHTISCPSEDAFLRVKQELDRLGFLLKE